MKRILKIVFLSIMMLPLCSCGKKSYKQLALEHLNKMYESENDEFVYINCEYDLFSNWNERCVFKSKKYNDDISVSFSNDGESITDNYYHAKYDDEIENFFNEKFSSHYKIFVSTKTNYQKQLMNNVYDYIGNLDIIDVWICTFDSDYNIELIKNKIQDVIDNINFNNYFYAQFYRVSEDDFNRIITELDIENYGVVETFNFEKKLEDNNT